MEVTGEKSLTTRKHYDLLSCYISLKETDERMH